MRDHWWIAFTTQIVEWLFFSGMYFYLCFKLSVIAVRIQGSFAFSFTFLLTSPLYILLMLQWVLCYSDSKQSSLLNDFYLQQTLALFFFFFYCKRYCYRHCFLVKSLVGLLFCIVSMNTITLARPCLSMWEPALLTMNSRVILLAWNNTQFLVHMIKCNGRDINCRVFYNYFLPGMSLGFLYNL